MSAAFAPVIGKPYEGELRVRFDEGMVESGQGRKEPLACESEQTSELHIRRHRPTLQWNNLKDVLDEKGQDEAKPLFWAIRDARDSVAARACSDALEATLRKHNMSALSSYLEAKDDLLAIHRLQLGAHLRKFFSTTNPIESLNSLLEEDLRRVKRWRNSEHFQRWLATACLQNEKRMRKIRGHSGVPALIVRIQELCRTQEAVDKESTAA